jgi:hypothetical protein
VTTLLTPMFVVLTALVVVPAAVFAVVAARRRARRPVGDGGGVRVHVHPPSTPARARSA